VRHRLVRIAASPVSLALAVVTAVAAAPGTTAQASASLVPRRAARATTSAATPQAAPALSRGAAPALSPLAAPAFSSQASRAVFLVNGERIAVTRDADGGGAGTVLPAAASAPGGITSFTLGGQDYAVPAALLPYLGHGLALSLFDLGDLQRLEQGGRLPVRISYTGRRRPALPGVRITGSARGVAKGYLTAASAQRLGAALSRQQISGGHNGVFAGRASLSLAATAATPAPANRLRATPRYPLTVTGTNLSGQPDNGGMVFVYDVDDSATFSGQGHFTNGTATFKVPAGHYWAIGIFNDFSATGTPAQHVVVLPQFTVTGRTTVTLAEKAATSKVLMVTPRPAVPDNSFFEILRPSRSGPLQFWSFDDAGIALWVSPTTARPTVGRLQTYTEQQLVSPHSVAGTPYMYDAAYQGPGGIIPSQRYLVRVASLARVDARYYQDVASRGAQNRLGLFPGQLSGLVLSGFNPLTMPRQQTEYLTGDPSIVWATSIDQSYRIQDLPGGQDGSAVQSFTAGQSLSENWNAYPLHPAPQVNLLGAANPFPVLPSASRAGKTLTLAVDPFGDNQPGHTGNGYSAGTFQIAVNGTRADWGPLPPGADGLDTGVNLGHGPADITLTLTASRAGKAYPLSPRTKTVWTWRSVPQPHAVVPAGWECAGSPVTGPPRRDCAVQPMMTLNYAVAGMGLTGIAPAGRQVIRISAGHLPLAPDPAITKLAVLVSFDGGQTWHAARVTGGAGGDYTATFAAPAGSLVTLRTSAADAAGGSVSETITNSYQAGT
jgi:hypothetical protein